MKLEPINPAPPVTRSFIGFWWGGPGGAAPQGFSTPVSLVLRLPVVVQAGVVVREAAFIRRVVEAIGDVDQHGRIGADHLVAVPDSGRNQELPRLQGSNEERVAHPERLRTGAQVEQANLKLPYHRHPQIALFEMVVQGFDRSRIAASAGDLQVVGSELRA